MTRLHPAARWGALLLAAGASLATSPDDSAPRLEAYVDAPAFHLNADHPAQGFVITVTPTAALLDAGLQGGGLNLLLTLRGVGPDGPAATLRIGFEQPGAADEAPPAMNGVGVAPGETRELSVAFDLFVGECAALSGCPQEVVVGFEHLGGADVEATWAVEANAHVGGSESPPEGAVLDIDVRETSDIPD